MDFDELIQEQSLPFCFFIFIVFVCFLIICCTRCGQDSMCFLCDKCKCDKCKCDK